MSVLKDEFEKVKRDVIAKHIALGMEASGNWIEQLEVVTEGENKVSLFGEGYTEQLVNGREPSTLPPVDAIEQWISDKGLNVPIDMTQRQLAWAISVNIKNNGTKYYQEGGTDLLDEVLTEKRILEIVNKAGIAKVEDFVFEMDELFKRMNK